MVEEICLILMHAFHAHGRRLAFTAVGVIEGSGGARTVLEADAPDGGLTLTGSEDEGHPSRSLPNRRGGIRRSLRRVDGKDSAAVTRLSILPWLTANGQERLERVKSTHNNG